MKALGVRLAIDVSEWVTRPLLPARFPIDILKIDRAFVSRLTEQDGVPSLRRAVVDARRDARLETVAEGIENEDQWLALLDLGCVAGEVPVRQLEFAGRGGGHAIHGPPRGCGRNARARRPHGHRALSRHPALALVRPAEPDAYNRRLPR